MNHRRHKLLPIIFRSVVFGWLLALAILDSEAGEPITLKMNGWVGAVAFSPDGKLLATGSADNVARLFVAATGQEIAALRGHGDYVASVAFSPDGKTLATGSYDHTARLWDVATYKERFVLAGHRGVVMSVVFNPDGSMLATGGIDRAVKLWHVSTGKLFQTGDVQKSWINSVVFHPRGEWLASGSSDGTIRVWRAPTLDLEAETVAMLTATKAEVRAIAVSPDRRWLAAGLRYGIVKTWDTKSWTERLSIHGHEEDVWAVAFLPDSKSLVSGNGAWNRPGEVKFWNVASGRSLTSLPQSGEVLSLAISPDGQFVAAGCRDKTATISKVPLLRP